MFFESFWLNCTIAVGLIVTLTFDYVTKFFSYWYVRHIPYKTSVPFFGSDYHRVLGLRNTTQEVTALYKQYPKDDFVGSVKSRIPDLILRNPDLIKEVLCTEFESFKSRGLDLDKSRDICLRNNLFYAEGEKWTLLRERLEPLLNDVTVSEDCILGSLSGTNGNINVQQLLTKLLDNVYKNMFLQGSDIGIVTDFRKKFQQRTWKGRIYNYIKNIFPSVYVAFGLKMLSKPTKNFVQAIKNSQFYKTIASIFDEESSRKLKSKPEELSIEILSSIISEGYIPTLNVLTALVYELAQNQKIQIQARNSSNNYLDAIIKETMRLHPPFAVITRKCVKMCKFSQSKVLIDKKVTINIPVGALHKDETHFKEAELFKPERFLEDATVHSYAFLPFGEGPRKCIGEKLSLQVIRSVAKAMIQKFQIEPTEKTPSKLKMADYNFGRVVDEDIWLRFSPL